MDAQSEQKPVILLVEDEVLIAKAYKEGLEREDLKVEVAVDGGEGISKAKKLQPAVILLDLVLPIRNGFEVLTELKKDQATMNIPVIVLTVSGRDSDLQKSKQFGAVDYLVKTELSMKQVIQRVKFHIR